MWLNRKVEWQIIEATPSLTFYMKGQPPSSAPGHIINNAGPINATLIIGPSVKEMSSAWLAQEPYSVLFWTTAEHDDSLSKNKQVKLHSADN